MRPRSLLCGNRPDWLPGRAEVVNMRPRLSYQKGAEALPCIGDGRQSGTSGSLNPERVARGGSGRRAGAFAHWG